MTLIDTFAGVLDRQKVRRLREKRGLSQAEAARAAGFSRQRWHELEQSDEAGNITLDTLNRIASVLGVKGRDLLK